MKKICTSLLSLMLLTSTNTNLSYASSVRANAGNMDVNVNVKVNLENSNKENSSQDKIAHISTFEDLKLALRNDKIEIIILEKNINAIGSLKIDRSIVLDLNGYKLQFLTKNSLIIGSVSSHTVEKTKYEPGHWEKKPTRYKIIEKGHYEEKKIPGRFVSSPYGNRWVDEHIEKIWIPEKKEALPDEYHWVDGHNYKVNETVYERNDIDVLIKNGSIYGKNGKNGKYNRYYKDGEDGSHAIVMVSGSLILKNAFVKGGNGGNGQNGDTTIGRSGGNGGNGGNAIHIYGKKEITTNGSRIEGGIGGIGGKKDHTGWTSIFCSEGNDGKDGSGYCI